MAEQRLSAIADRLEKAVTRMESLGKLGPSGGGTEVNTGEIVDEFDSQILNGILSKYFEVSKKIGGDISEHADIVRKCFNKVRDILVLASKHKQPKPDVAVQIFAPLSECITEAQVYAEKKRHGSEVFNHLMTVERGIPCVGWVAVDYTPLFYIDGCKEECQFYSNRIHKEYRDTNEDHVEWFYAFMKMFQELQEYISTYHTTGLTWNPEGTELTCAPGAGSPPPAVGGPPLPPVAGELPPDVQRPPKCELVNNKWIVEYQEGNSNIEITPTNSKEAIYIYECNKSTIKVHGKLNSIVMDSCKRVGLVFDSTISCVEAVNSQSVQIQVTGYCPAISIDKCDGCQVFLSKALSIVK